MPYTNLINVIVFVLVINSFNLLYAKNNNTISSSHEPVFVHWNEIVNTTVSKIYVEMNNMPYEIHYIGIGFNSKVEMENATMIILVRKINIWKCELHLGQTDTEPEYIKDYICDYYIQNNNLLMVFNVSLNISCNYVFYAYNNQWGFHGNNTGIAWAPKDYNIVSCNSIKRNINSTIINHIDNSTINNKTDIHAEIIKNITDKNSQLSHQFCIMSIIIVLFSSIIIIYYDH